MWSRGSIRSGSGGDPEIITFADAHAGHGSSQAWAKVTARTVRALARLDREQVDQKVMMGWVVSCRGGPSERHWTTSRRSCYTTRRPPHCHPRSTTPQTGVVVIRLPGWAPRRGGRSRRLGRVEAPGRADARGTDQRGLDALETAYQLDTGQADQRPDRATRPQAHALQCTRLL